MDWIGRIEQLRRWTRNGARAPHKPLLLLYALGRYQADGVTEDWRISVSGDFVGRSAAARTHVLSLAGQPPTPSQALYSHPKLEYIAWHQHEVFKHPARKPVPVG